MFTSFGDRVKTWITLNEPAIYSHAGLWNWRKWHQGSMRSELPHTAATHQIRAHARAVKAYRDDFWLNKVVKIGITQHSLEEPKKMPRIPLILKLQKEQWSLTTLVGMRIPYWWTASTSYHATKGRREEYRSELSKLKAA